MNKTYLLALAATLVAAPLAYAHSDGTPYGPPKTYCEDTKPGDTYNHDYVGGTGFLIALALDGSIPPCPYDPTWDGHYEWAFGGAWLLACEAFCGGKGGKKLGDGVTTCWGNYADHSQFPDVWVFDHFMSLAGLPVTMFVGADFWNNIPPTSPTEPNCGDFETDYGVECMDMCSIDFPAGKDGSYQVYVSGTAGHVWST